MRVLWYSNAPWTKTGYGNQTQLITESLPKYGHDLAILANYGLAGRELRMGDVMVYPGGKDVYGRDVLRGTCEEHKADVLVSLYDIWPLTFKEDKEFKTPWVAWAPIDHQTLPPEVKKQLEHTDVQVAYSKHGERAMIDGGLPNVHYIPHGINTKLFTPGDKVKARERVGLPRDKFVVGMIATNRGYPSRKSLPQVLEGAAIAIHDMDLDLVLYMHMNPTTENGGVDLYQMAQELKITDRVYFCDQWHYTKGFPQSYLADVYRAIDVLANPAMGEGFGIPIVEAMASGTPVIGTAGTSMLELIGHGGSRGMLVRGEKFWSQQGAYQILPNSESIAEAMAVIEDKLRDDPDTYRGTCRGFAVENYDFEAVVAPMWHELLEVKPWEK